MAANRSSPVHEATLQANWLLQRIGRELRAARIAAGLTQQAVARRLSLSTSEVSRIERAEATAIGIVALHRHAAVVGLRPWLRLYPGGRHVLDQPQLGLLERLRLRLPRCSWQLEVPVPIEGDLRAADALITCGDLTLVVDPITRLSDVQAQVRAAQLKRRDIGADRLVVLVGASTANRAALHAAGQVISAAFRTGTRRLLNLLADGKDPGGDCLLLL